MSGSSEVEHIMRRHIYVPKVSKAPLYLPQGYKTRRKNVVVDGISQNGEISLSGIVKHAEDWEGRVAVEARPATIHYTFDKDGKFRPLTIEEMRERGYFIRGQGPVGVRRARSGIEHAE